MHMVIRTIVYAKDKNEAISKAHGVFNRLTENQHPFDYYQMFDNEGTPVSGKGRWGSLPALSKVDSKNGKKLIDEGMKYTHDEFISSVKKVRETINAYTDEQLFEDKDVKIDGMIKMFKYFCSCLGEYAGPRTWLYDNEGEGIHNEHDLKNVLSKWKCIYEDAGKENPYKDMFVWVVPADVHY